LDDYVAAIYYVTGEGKEKAAVSPVVEKLTNRGCGDLYASEALDEIMLEALREYNDIDVKDAAKDNLNLGGDENDEEKKEKEAFTEGFLTTAYLETILAGKVQKVAVISDLSDSPVVLVQGAYRASESNHAANHAAIHEGPGGSGY